MVEEGGEFRSGSLERLLRRWLLSRPPKDGKGPAMEIPNKRGFKVKVMQ